MLQDVKGTILKDAKKDGESALKAAEEELEAEFSRVKGEGEAKIAAADEEAKRMVEGERRERLSWAKLESKRVLAEAREDAANSALESLIELVKAYASTKQYSDTMRRKVAAAVAEVGGKAVVHVKSGDKKHISIPNADVVEDADILGGAIVESKDGRLRIDLSMESMMEAKRDELRKDIYDRLFSENAGKADKAKAK